jgi:hypothetical protein
MAACFVCRNKLKALALGIPLLLASISVAQEQATLLRLQRSRATLNLDATGGARGQGGNILSLGPSGSQMGVSSYPNSASCVLVYNDGKYVLEKRDEQTVGRPKVKTAEGTLSPDDMQQLKSILDNDELKQIKLKPIEPPPGAQMLREAEMLDVQIGREAATQHFVAMKARFKSQAIGTSEVSDAPSTGLDAYLDNASSYKKTLTPLTKWFDGLEKKSKSSFKDAKPQYCAPMTIG